MPCWMSENTILTKTVNYTTSTTSVDSSLPKNNIDNSPNHFCNESVKFIISDLFLRWLNSKSEAQII